MSIVLRYFFDAGSGVCLWSGNAEAEALGRSRGGFGTKIPSLDALPPAGANVPRLLDLGTGSGAIALTVADRRPDAHVTATDASADALTVAQANAQRLGLPVRFAHGAWLAAVPGERFDVIASNPPYIAEGDPHLDALTHEPLSALTAGADGLDDRLRHLLDHCALLVFGTAFHHGDFCQRHVASYVSSER